MSAARRDEGRYKKRDRTRSIVLRAERDEGRYSERGKARRRAQQEARQNAPHRSVTGRYEGRHTERVTGRDKKHKALSNRRGNGGRRVKRLLLRHVSHFNMTQRGRIWI